MGGRLKVYCETSFWSWLLSRPSTNPVNAVKQAYSLKWWETVAPDCDLFVSDFVFDEVQDGDAEASAKRVAEILKIPFLSLDMTEVETLANTLRDKHQIFQREITDAAHIAAASIAGMDVLLTWNCKHMANIVELPKTVRIITQAGYECPMIVTPEDYLEKRHA